ncbi:SET domain-containing protein-lysine N-methyltransferase [archaeon]|nr:SET domain-containing protein-lysine N-methyltransferase [archaeon]
MIRNFVEALHLEYLCANFGLAPGTEASSLELNGSHPDLVNQGKRIDSVFELKSRTFPRQQKGRRRPVSDFAWWTLDNDQIARYEHIAELNPGVGLYWIFLLGETEEQPTTLTRVSEQQFLRRDIYVAPWDAHQLVEQSSGRHSNRYVGLGRLRQYYSFRSSDVAKGELHIAAYLDPRNFGMYINHSCNPNTGVRGTRSFVARRPIKKGEEIIIMGFELTDKPIKPKNILVDKKNKFVRFL